MGYPRTPSSREGVGSPSASRRSQRPNMQLYLHHDINVMERQKKPLWAILNSRFSNGAQARTRVGETCLPAIELLF